jgi:hypothetical protein
MSDFRLTREGEGADMQWTHKEPEVIDAWVQSLEGPYPTAST